jgi:hypothetical protein
LSRIGIGRQGPRFHQCRWIVSALFWSIAFNCIPSQSHAAGLDCPELGTIAIPNLFADLQIKLVATGNTVDLANEINDAVNKLQIAQPNISYAELTNVAIAAYCLDLVCARSMQRGKLFRRDSCGWLFVGRLRQSIDCSGGVLLAGIDRY